MKAGKLRHLVTVQRPTGDRSASGAALATFVDYLVDVRAAVEPITGQERWAASQVAAEVTARIRMRYRDGLTAQMRVLYRRGAGSPSHVDVYDVSAVVPADGRKGEVHLHCVKRDAEGFRSGER